MQKTKPKNLPLVKSFETHSAFRVEGSPRSPHLSLSVNKYIHLSIEYEKGEGIWVCDAIRERLVPLGNIKDIEFLTATETIALEAEREKLRPQPQAI